MREIPLTQGKVAFVDDKDFEELVAYKWHARKCKNRFYAGRQIKKNGVVCQVLAMHNVIMDPEFGTEVDHIDGNGLNNQRLNLRAVSHRVNCQNIHVSKSSKFTGVSWSKSALLWLAQLKYQGTTRSLGHFQTEEEACEAYKIAMERIASGLPIQEYIPTKKKRGTSKYRGVYRIKESGRWVSRIQVNKKQIHLGVFGTEEEAAEVYRKEAEKLGRKVPDAATR